MEYYDTAVDDFSPYLPKSYLDYIQAELSELMKSCAFSEGEVVDVTFESTFFDAKLGYADKGIVSLFNFDILQGDYRRALSVKNNALIPVSLARKIFQDRNPIGQTITINGEIPLTVTAIYEDLPNNSSLKNMIYTGLPLVDDWENWIYFNYYHITGETNIKALEKKINESGKNNDMIIFSSLKGLRPLQEVYLCF